MPIKIIILYVLRIVFCVGNTALALAIQKRRLNTVKILVSTGTPVNVKNKYGNNILLIKLKDDER